MDPPILPQEILDAIIDHLAEPQLNLGSSAEQPSALQLNVAALKACSLVSRAFAHRAQPYIFALFKLSTDAEMTEEEKIRRIERRRAVVRLFEAKPQIMRGIRGISIDLIFQDAFPALFRFDTTVDNDLIYALKKVPNITLVYAYGGLCKPETSDKRPYLRLHLLPINYGMMTTLVISEFDFDFAAVASMPSLCHFSMTSVKFIPDEGEPPVPKPLPGSKPTRLFINELELMGSRDNMLDVITDNTRGTGPHYYPILDFSALRSLKLGDHYIIEDDHSEYLSSLWRLFGYCSHTIETLELSNRHLFDYTITRPFIPVGETEATMITFKWMRRLHSLTLKIRPINLILQTGHDALRDVIHLLNSLPADNKVSSITLILDIHSEEDLLFNDLTPYADWSGLVACLNRTTNGRRLGTLRFYLHWMFLVDDLSLFNGENIGSLTANVFHGLDANVTYILDDEPLDTRWSTRWHAVDKAAYTQAAGL